MPVMPVSMVKRAARRLRAAAIVPVVDTRRQRQLQVLQQLTAS
eukprot:COSAG02_NODE_72282_length_186_cov_274.942529_1_plen_42_part_10